MSDALKAAHPEVAWREIAQFRNVVVHDYLGIDLARVWDIVQRDLPELKHSVAAIMKELGIEASGTGFVIRAETPRSGEGLVQIRDDSLRCFPEGSVRVRQHG